MYNSLVANDLGEKTCRRMSKDELNFLKIADTDIYCTLPRVREHLAKCTIFDKPTVLV